MASVPPSCEGDPVYLSRLRATSSSDILGKHCHVWLSACTPSRYWPHIAPTMMLSVHGVAHSVVNYVFRHCPLMTCFQSLYSEYCMKGSAHYRAYRGGVIPSVASSSPSLFAACTLVYFFWPFLFSSLSDCIIFYVLFIHSRKSSVA